MLIIKYREVFIVKSTEAVFDEGSKLHVTLEQYDKIEFTVRTFKKATVGDKEVASLVLEKQLCNGYLTISARGVDIAKKDLPKQVRDFLSEDNIKQMEKEPIAIALAA